MDQLKSIYKIKHHIELINTSLSDVEDDLNKIINEQSPRFIHQRLCSRLTRIAKNNVGKKLEDVPDYMNTITALDVIEEMYPYLVND